MNNRENRDGVRFWEYGWYILVTAALLAAGIVLVVFTAAGWLIRVMRKRLLIGAVVLGVIVIGVGFVLWQYYGQVDLGERTISIIVKPGDSFSGVAARMAREGVVRSRYALTIPARLSGADRKLVPGRYDFVGANSAASALERLEAGDFLRVKLTIPEGSTIWAVAGMMGRGLDLDSAAVVRLNWDSAFLAMVGKPCLEGYLYPETYFFPWGISEREAVQVMVGMFDKVTGGIWPSELTLGLSKHEIIILASIIESETPLANERALVASVYVNRLRNKMRLDADPTVIYGLGGLGRPLYRGDLRRDTPYNTYLRGGLPPTPINSPGLASILAALAPEESEYLFFVADDTGGHYFSRTNAEHNRARQRINQQRVTQ